MWMHSWDQSPRESFWRTWKSHADRSPVEVVRHIDLRWNLDNVQWCDEWRNVKWFLNRSSRRSTDRSTSLQVDRITNRPTNANWDRLAEEQHRPIDSSDEVNCPKELDPNDWKTRPRNCRLWSSRLVRCPSSEHRLDAELSYLNQLCRCRQHHWRQLRLTSSTNLSEKRSQSSELTREYKQRSRSVTQDVSFSSLRR